MTPARSPIDDLAAIVAARRKADPASSYTAQLLSRGVGHCARKMGEEAVETVVAAVEGDRDRIRAEAADLLYHLIVLLEATGVELESVYAELTTRSGMSGLAEKASRQE